jgi:IS5 family transposase
MQPKTTVIDQGDLFRSRLDQILNRRHPLYRLADTIDWSVFDKDFGKLYVENVGRPGLLRQAAPPGGRSPRRKARESHRRLD